MSAPSPGSALRRIFLLGLALRLVVGWFLAPANNDPHLEVIAFIAESARPPFSDELTLGFQPPLYYLLAAPLLALSGSAKVVQLLSVALALVNFGLIHRFLGRTRLLTSERGRLHAALLNALLPQFVLFSLFVSNDALAFPVGTWLVLALLRWLERPTARNLFWVALAQGVGLSTKGTFIAYLPIVLSVIAVVALRERWRLGAGVRAVALFAAVTALVGGYKFAENAHRFGTPVVSNEHLEQAWVVHQQGTYQGVSSLIDVNVAKLVREPFVADSNRHSIPLLMYGTFWYSLIRESNFTHTREDPWTVVPRAIYALAAVPSLVLVLGVLALLARCRPWRDLRGPAETFRLRVAEVVFLLALLGQTTLVLTWGFKHDAWSFFQTRLVFAAFASIALLFGVGFDALERRPQLARGAAAVSWALYASFGAYYLIEMAGELLEP